MSGYKPLVTEGITEQEKTDIAENTASRYDNAITVKTASQLAGDLLSDKLYIIDGVIDMGSTSIEVPQNGLSLKGLGFEVSSLTSSENNHTLFVDGSGNYAGDLIIEELAIEVTGSGSKVMDIDNLESFGAVEFQAVNFNNCTSMGEVSSYRQFRISNVAFFNPQDGLIFSGAWAGGALWTESIAILVGAGVTLFKEGTALTFSGSVRTDMNFLSVDTTSVFCDFQESNIIEDGGFLAQEFRAGNSDPIPNLPSNSTKANFIGCIGLRNTYPGSFWEVTTGATTTISSSNTLVKMAGTTTYSEENWFSNTTNNACVFDSEVMTDFKINYSLSFTGGNNDVVGVQIRQWDDSASSYINIGARQAATLNGGASGLRAENVAGFAYATMDMNDRIEIWIENQSDTTNITTDNSGSLIISER